MPPRSASRVHFPDPIEPWRLRTGHCRCCGGCRIRPPASFPRAEARSASRSSAAACAGSTATSSRRADSSSCVSPSRAASHARSARIWPRVSKVPLPRVRARRTVISSCRQPVPNPASPARPRHRPGAPARNDRAALVALSNFDPSQRCQGRLVPPAIRDRRQAPLASPARRFPSFERLEWLRSPAPRVCAACLADRSFCIARSCSRYRSCRPIIRCSARAPDRTSDPDLARGMGLCARGTGSRIAR